MNSNDLRHNNLYFFDKNGEYYNFSYEGIVELESKPIDWDTNKTIYYKKDPNNPGEYVNCSINDDWGIDENSNELSYFMKSDKWIGDIYLDDTSTGIFSVGSILLLEKDKDGNYRLPWKKRTNVVRQTGSNSLSQGRRTLYKNVSSFICEFSEDNDAIFLFGYKENFVSYTQTSLSQEPDGADLIRTEFLSVELSNSTDIRSEAAQINFALCSSEENTFKRTLLIYEVDEDNELIYSNVEENLVAVITVYGKTIDEDERLKTICENFGYNIIDTDTIAFEKTNIKEILPDWTIINEKRKEIILEGHNIYPFIGAYKGIINVIKYFGYNELQLREFWKNVDPDSPYYGKYVQTDCIDFISVDNVRFNQPKVTLPSKQYRKTSLFSLVYKINDITENAYDEDNLPLTHENQQFTQEEILIKLFSLKKKLEKDFLPLNARIKDIVGEADYFSLNELTDSIGVNIKNNIQVGLQPSFTVINGEKYNELDDKIYANLTDLRIFLADYYNSTTNNVDDTITSFYNKANTVGDIVSYLNMFVSPREKYSLIIDNELVTLKSIMEENACDSNFSIKKLKDIYLAYFNDYSPNIRYTGYLNDNRPAEYLEEIDPLPDNWKMITNLTLNNNKEYGLFDEDANNALPENDKFKVFNNVDTVPVGALVILKNTTFDNFIFEDETDSELLDDLNITYNELAKGNRYDVLTFGLENFSEYTINAEGVVFDAEENDELVLKFDNVITISYTTTRYDTVSSIMRTIYVKCIEAKNYHPDFFHNIHFYFDEVNNELNVQGIDSYKLDWKIVHPLSNPTDPLSVESDMRYSVAVSNRKTVSNNIFTWDSIDKHDTTGIEWTIKKDATEFSPSYYFNSFQTFNDKSIEKFNELPIVLPYIGTYTIEMRLYNMYNHMSSVVKKDFLEVVGREVEFSAHYIAQEETNGFQQDTYEETIEEYGSCSGSGAGSYSGSGVGSFSGSGAGSGSGGGSGEGHCETVHRYNITIDPSEDVLDYWSSDAVVHRNNQYTWENCGNYIINEYGSTWENAIKPSTSWGDGESSLYEGLDNANAIENNTINYRDINMHTTNYRNDGNYSNKGAYIWKNCKCSWNEAYHKSWDFSEETGDIPFYIDIDLDKFNIPFSMTKTYNIEGTDILVNINTPKIRFELQEEQKSRFELINNEDDFIEFNIQGLSLIRMCKLLNQWLENSYGINLDRFINVNYVYNENEYAQTIEYITSVEKLYLEPTQNQNEFKHFVLVQVGNSFEIREDTNYSQIDSGNGQQEYEHDIYYLKEIADADFNQNIGYIYNENVIKRSPTELVPIVNICKLQKLASRPTYVDSVMMYTSAFVEEEVSVEERYVLHNEMENVPDSYDLVNCPYVKGLVPWKYYKKETGRVIDVNNTTPKIWYYTHIDSSSIGPHTQHIDRLIPTTSPIQGITYTVTTDYSVVMDRNNYNISYEYRQYPEKINYEYYKVVPCEHYRLIPYERKTFEPDSAILYPHRVQLIGKYCSQLCDLFDVSVVWNMTDNNLIYTSIDLGLENTGIIKHDTEIHNPTWNNVQFLNSWKKLPKMTRLYFTYDKCKIIGKRNPTWIFKNITTGSEKIVRSKYGVYMFTEAGDYSVTLELYDSNKNKYIDTKNYFTIV